jgi:uroporphyrin-III C-methyltransferase/precorrin-2 dehydrogenase/sirohydrochlorin ferrochelatase
MGAAASLDVSLTHRDHARRLQFITAHARDGRLPADLDWKALADPAATTAVYMGKLVVAEVSQRLIAAGLDPKTPAIIVEYATQERQRSFHTSVEAMPGIFTSEALDGPCVMLIGRAMAEAEGFARPREPALAT